MGKKKPSVTKRMTKGVSKGIKMSTRALSVFTGGNMFMALGLFLLIMFLVISIIMVGVVAAGGGYLVLYRPDSLTKGFDGLDLGEDSGGGNRRPPGQIELLPGSRFYYPSDRGRLTSLYGLRNVKGGSRDHKGIDVGGIHGNVTEIFPSRPGVVVEAHPYEKSKLPSSHQVKGPNGSSPSSGQWVAVEHEVEGVKMKTVYMHMFRVLVEKGQIVNMDTPLGIVGTTGASTGPHIHFEIHINGEKVDPLKYLYCGGKVPVKDEDIAGCYNFRGEYE